MKPSTPITECEEAGEEEAHVVCVRHGGRPCRQDDPASAPATRIFRRAVIRASRHVSSRSKYTSGCPRYTTRPRPEKSQRA